MKVIEVAALLLLVISSGVRLDSRSTCSEDKKCSNSETCCGNICVDSSKVCKVACQKQSDCDSLGNAKCIDGFCECVEELSCSNTSTLHERFTWNQPCSADVDCSQNANSKCRNRTCVVTKERQEKMPLNPALLAIVAIIGVLMFSCLFCCCLSRMKSERKSMKTRVAKGKLKKVHVQSNDNEDAVKLASFPLLNAESHVSSATAEKKTMILDKDEEALISVVMSGLALPPIREEDEFDDADKD